MEKCGSGCGVFHGGCGGGFRCGDARCGCELFIYVVVAVVVVVVTEVDLVVAVAGAMY